MIIDAASPNYDFRPSKSKILFVVIHYTGMIDSESAIERLRDSKSKVSAHWLIDESGSIFKLVDECCRAWHAGISEWKGYKNINSYSIGIELVNPGHDLGYTKFKELQMQSLESLIKNITLKYGLHPNSVIGHSDIAPDRKKDPGELFDWPRLAKLGLAFCPKTSINKHKESYFNSNDSQEIKRMQSELKYIGYAVKVDGVLGNKTNLVLTAFRRRFLTHDFKSMKYDNLRARIKEVFIASS